MGLGREGALKQALTCESIRRLAFFFSEMLYYDMNNLRESGKLVEVKAYQQTDEKPDKLYSHLPSVLEIVGDLRGQTVLDLGCGSGFYTREYVKMGAWHVV